MFWSHKIYVITKKFPNNFLKEAFFVYILNSQREYPLDLVFKKYFALIWFFFVKELQVYYAWRLTHNGCQQILLTTFFWTIFYGFGIAVIWILCVLYKYYFARSFFFLTCGIGTVENQTKYRPFQEYFGG